MIAGRAGDAGQRWFQQHAEDLKEASEFIGDLSLVISYSRYKFMEPLPAVASPSP